MSTRSDEAQSRPGTSSGEATRRRYWCEYAWLPPGVVARDVLVTVEGTRLAGVEPGVRERPPDAVRLHGLTLPGFANAHSHAFHRALRGRTGGYQTFWSWRDQMYELADRLDPDSYFALARAVYAEMALAGITCVGEFHYLHHDRGGRPYAEPNVMAEALIAAAREAGLRITLLDTCYLSGGIGRPLTGAQLRFGDGDADRWAERASRLAQEYVAQDDVVVGAAVHSVRAVPRDQLATVAGWIEHDGDGPSPPLHVHLSEQPGENEECLVAYGRTPTRLLHETGVLGPRCAAVHATHVDAGDRALLGQTGAAVVVCPTTERDLADGLGPVRELEAAGCPLALGSDSHAVIDPFGEARALEYGERLRTLERGNWTAAALLRIGGEHGHATLGFADAGMLVPGAWADLVTVRLDSVRTATAGAPEDAVVYAATTADIEHVVASGRVVVAEGRHAWLGDIGLLLRSSLSHD